ncbi:MAG: hypothetical protein ABIL58_04190 [Pseudomonadota bacterium]
MSSLLVNNAQVMAGIVGIHLQMVDYGIVIGSIGKRSGSMMKTNKYQSNRLTRVMAVLIYLQGNASCLVLQIPAFFISNLRVAHPL